MVALVAAAAAGPEAVAAAAMGGTGTAHPATAAGAGATRCWRCCQWLELRLQNRQRQGSYSAGLPALLTWQPLWVT